MAALRPLLLIALLLGLVLHGTVPDGMMRQAGPEGGLRLVLCTPEGTKEVWLTEDGEAVPVETGGHDSTGHKPHCVQVALTFHDAPPPLGAPHPFILRPADLPRRSHQVLHRQVAGDARRSRAPPVPRV